MPEFKENLNYVYLVFSELTGDLQGAQYTTISGMVGDDGKWIARPNVSADMPVSVSEGQAGISFTELAAKMDLASVSAVSEKNAELAAKQAALLAMTQSRDQVIAERNAIKAELDALKAPPAERRVEKLVIVDRLIAAGKIEAALAAINSNPILKARWDAAQSVRVNDESALTLLAAIGADPAVILA